MSDPFTTVSGRKVNLYRPVAPDIDFDDIAEQLAKEARFNGATPNVFYSVAQHVVLGAEWLESAGANFHGVGFEGTDARRQVAAYFLCHDFHEAYLKDKTTPLKRMLDEVASEFGEALGVISEAYARAEERFDAAIHVAAGLAWPPPGNFAEVVKDIDLRMLATEWRALRPAHELPLSIAGVAPLPVTIVPWDWEQARVVLRKFMHDLLPALRKGEAA